MSNLEVFTDGAFSSSRNTGGVGVVTQRGLADGGRHRLAGRSDPSAGLEPVPVPPSAPPDHFRHPRRGRNLGVRQHRRSLRAGCAAPEDLSALLAGRGEPRPCAGP